MDFALPRGGVITGRITDEFGEPVTGVLVRIERYQYGPAGRRLAGFAFGMVAARYTRTARPDQSGVFRVRALPPGRYRAVAVDAIEPGSEWDPVFQAIVRPMARGFALSEGQTVTLDLDLLP